MLIGSIITAIVFAVLVGWAGWHFAIATTYRWAATSWKAHKVAAAAASATTTSRLTITTVTSLPTSATTVVVTASSPSPSHAKALLKEIRELRSLVASKSNPPVVVTNVTIGDIGENAAVSVFGNVTINPEQPSMMSCEIGWTPTRRIYPTFVAGIPRMDSVYFQSGEVIQIMIPHGWAVDIDVTPVDRVEFLIDGTRGSYNSGSRRTHIKMQRTSMTFRFVAGCYGEAVLVPVFSPM